MAMILDAFVDALVSKFAELLFELAKGEVGMLVVVPGEVTKLKDELRMISKVVADAERRIDDSAMDEWVKLLKDFMYDADDILDLCRIQADERREGSSSTSWVRFPFSFLPWFRKPPATHDIGSKIRELNVRLEEISRVRCKFNLEPTSPDKQQQVTSQISRRTSPVVEIDIVGSRIEEDTQSLVDSLIKDDTRRNISVCAVVGAGGIGKTTLARRIYNDQRIDGEFSVKKWVCVSQDFDEINLLKEMYNGDKGDLAQEQSRSSLEPKVQSSLRDHKLFLVLDDVWTGKLWCELLHNTLSSCAAGSRILVTTRNEQIAMQMLAVIIHHVSKLSLEDGWSLLCKKVVLTGEEGEIQHLKDIGMEIVGKCDGLPLALKTVAGVLCTKEKTRRAWDGVLKRTAWSTSGLPEEVKGALYLSYQDLPSYLKQCFIYCSLFPEDHIIYMRVITQLWIAEGFVKAEGSSTMEETAEEYYRELIMRNLLQSDLKDQRSCKMHDLLHCLARYLALDESSVVRKAHEVGCSNRPMKLRRVYVRDYETTEIFDVLVKQYSLRTLIWQRSPMSQTQMDVVFNELSRLRVLDLSFSDGIQRLPDSLGSLIHLRYLNISKTKISVIPETIGNLRNLQFLDISWTMKCVIPETIWNLRNLQFLDISCTKIIEIPETIGNLRNLQFLDISCNEISEIPESIGNLKNLRCLNIQGCVSLSRLPNSIVNLHNLQVLRGFMLPRNRTEGFCTMEELRFLLCLTDLSINELEHTSGSSEAKAAELRNKSKLRSLSLSCTRGPQQSEEEMRRIEEVFEELHPPSCLEELRVGNYFGREFPKWMAETSSSTSLLFPNLRLLGLRFCEHCERLPPCGLLPHLESLSIIGAASVIDVGPEFLIGGRVGVDSSKCAFPKLETLEFHHMPNWQEWRWDTGTQAMPHLKYLFLYRCPKLMSLPEGLLFHATSLTKLAIQRAGRLTTIKNLLSLKELYIKYCHNLENVSDLPALTTIKIMHCPKLKVMENLQSLKWMNLVDYYMESLPSYLLKGVQRGTKKRKRVHAALLEKLEIHCNMGLMENICRRAGPEWTTIQNIQQVRVYSADRANTRSVHVFYNKSPFSFTTNFDNTTTCSTSGGIGL